MEYISGTYFKHKCRWQFTNYINARQAEFTIKENFNISNDYVFCKVEFLQTLSSYIKNHVINLPDNYKLFTHNSDINITDDIANIILEMFPGVGHIYSQNLLSSNPMFSPIPIGIANPKWSHGNIKTFDKVRSIPIEKSKIVYVNFNVATNPSHRNYCLSQINHSVDTNYPNYTNIDAHDNFVNNTHTNYLLNIKSSYFIISPDGNGKDCHKTWESIYMGSIPIITRSRFAEDFQRLGIPLMIVNDWNEYNEGNLTPDLYKDIWGSFDINKLGLELFLNV